MSIEFLLVALGFATVAVVYSSAGFGGGSSYLAILAVVLTDINEVRTVALICNLCVVSNSLAQFVASKQISWRESIKIVALSVPMAFVGALMPLRDVVFLGLLGIVLIVAALAMIYPANSNQRQTPHVEATARCIGSLIGLLSGLVGIGGGIFLSPALNLIRWRDERTIAATATLFIFANSIAGLFGLAASGRYQFGEMQNLVLPTIVLIGGTFGVRYCIKVSEPAKLRRITAMVILIAGIRVALKAFSI